MTDKLLRIFFIIIIHIFIFINSVFAYNWFVEGRWDYYYIIKSEDFHPLNNESNNQNIMKYLPDDKVLIKNTCIYKPFEKSVGYPYTVKDEFESYLEEYYKEDTKNKYIKDFAESIVKDSRTIDEAVEKISVWIRNNVFYSLGTAKDPIGVIKSKRAYCEGYANTAVYLLRSIGIPARTLTCYVPPGNGWGNNRGGYHAYLEFYYPEKGWYCIDPQNSLNFADPFHITYYPHGAGAVTQLKKIDDTYIVGVDDEPSKWGTFKSGGNYKLKDPVFIFKIRDHEGKYRNTYIPVKLKKNKISFHSDRNKSWYDKRGFKADIGKKFIWVKNSEKSKYLSLIIRDEEFKKKKFSDEVYINLNSSLFIKKIDFKGAGKYFFEADFTNDVDVKKIILLDNEDNPLPGKDVHVKIGKDKYFMKTDKSGYIYLKVDANKIQIVFEEKTYKISFKESNIIRLFKKKNKKNFIEEYIKEKQIDAENTNILICITYDETGTVSRTAFDNIYIYNKKLKQTSLIPENPGLIIYNKFELDTDYYIVFEKNNRYIKKKIRFKKNEIQKLEIDIKNEKFIILEDELGIIKNKDTIFYEYYINKNPLTYKTIDGRIYISFPEGEYLFSDSNTAKMGRFIKIDGKKSHIFYEINTIDLNEFDRINEFFYLKKQYISGYISIMPAVLTETDYQNNIINKIKNENDKNFIKSKYEKINNYHYPYKLRSDVNTGDMEKVLKILTRIHYYSAKVKNSNIVIIDKKTGAGKTYKINDTGYFYINNLIKDNDYLLYFYKNKNLITANIHVSKDNKKNLILSNITNFTVIDAKRLNSTYYFNKNPISWFIPINNPKGIIFKKIDIDPFQYNGIFYFSFEDSTYYFSMEKDFNKIIKIDNKDSISSYNLHNYLDDSAFINEFKKLNELYYTDKTSMLIRIKKDKKNLINYNLNYTVGNSKQALKVGENGIGNIIGITDNEIEFDINTTGVYLRKKYEAQDGKTNILEIDLEKDHSKKIIIEGSRKYIKYRKIILYQDAEINKDNKIKYSQKIYTKADENGICYLVIPENINYLEINSGDLININKIKSKIVKVKLK